MRRRKSAATSGRVEYRQACHQKTDGLGEGDAHSKERLAKESTEVFYSINLQDSSRFYKYVFQANINGQSSINQMPRFISNGSGWWLDLVGDIPSNNFIVLGEYAEFTHNSLDNPHPKAFRVKSHLQVV
jgi:hypothetical protein